MERVGLNARDIHGDLDQAQRTKALDAFKAGEIDFLVATDVAARGLDIARLPCVINYDVPIHADDYIHRIGRTARAGREGRAFTLALPDEGRFVDAITRLTGKQMPRLEIGGMDEPDMADEPQGRRRRGRTRKDAQPAPPETRPEAREEPPRSEARSGPDTDDVATSRETSPETSIDRPARRGRSWRARGAQSEPRSPADPTSTGPAPKAPPAPAPASGAMPNAPTSAPAQAAAPTLRERPAASTAPAPSERGRKGRAPAPQPVVGMGEHVPLFMRRPVPNPRPVDKPGEE